MESIIKAYKDNIVSVNEYISHIVDMFINLCKSNDEQVHPIDAIDGLLSSKNVNDYISEIREEANITKEKIEFDLEKYNDKIKTVEDSVSPENIAEIRLYESLIEDVKKGKTETNELYDSAKGLLEVYFILFGDKQEGEKYLFLDNDDDRIYAIISMALNDFYKSKFIELNNNRNYLQNILNSLNLFDTNNLMCIYRQAFIQTMAYFDFCVFELMRKSMFDNFEFWIKQINDDKIKFSEIAKFSSFDELKSNIIEDILKKYYVKDLLCLCKKVDSNLFVIGEHDVYAEIREIINRRNIHLHNNGLVDDFYIKDFNIYSFSADDYLTIDENYLNRTFYLTEKIVDSISAIKK